MKEYDKALENFDKIIELDSTFTFAHHNKGLIYMEMGEYDKAIKHFNDALNNDSDYIPSYMEIANVLSRSGKKNNAIAYYRKVIEMDKEDGWKLKESAQHKLDSLNNSK